ncbi:hypothetical protein LRS74_32420 [Streptomyces sp. LX-29]|uniref:alpha/beta hydrolase family protein n=1 Tax=Streptomyces sp. LX-29 TaxID=2900152 RepID=UPI00240CF5AB|nr:hypothetical protein [Streptomyces sp. LX-29]WFB11217.1 hypothetical protein LRS74_32420 [Streptomyces sp. LX-29]
MIRVPRLVTAGTAALALAVGLPVLAYAQPSAEPISSTPQAHSDDRLPEGWQLTGSGADKQLVWRSSDRVPMGDARVEFHAGGKLLGRPTADKDGRTFRLPLAEAPTGSMTELQVLAGGRRLDAAATDAAPGGPRPIAPAAPAAPLPANKVDPGKPGKYRTAGGEYGLKSVRLPGFPAPVEMRATVVGPVDAPGRRPVALFLHGRHYTCYNAKGEIEGGWPCRTGMKSVPSYRGYLHDQKLLASQGYVTVSISANGINGQDDNAEDGGAQARSSLVRQHLGDWAEWAADRSKAPAVVRKVAPADMDRVLLVGHSRGGEGVNRAALDSLAQPPAGEDGYKGPVRWKVRGTVLIGPTIFGQNPVPDVPSTTILPGCDGDVSDLQGQIFADGTRGVSSGTALHSSVYMVGANHNYFNTEWTPGQAQAPADDDFWAGDKPDSLCSAGKKTRLTAKQQQKAGSTYIAAAARLFVAGDDKVRPLLDGSNLRAPSADPARVYTHAVGANRMPLVVPDPSAASVTGGKMCLQVDHSPAACLPPTTKGASPHFAGWAMSPEPGRHAIAMGWPKAGSTTRVSPNRPVSVKGAQSLALRVIVPPNTSGTELEVAITDASDRRAKLGKVRVDGLPGTDRTASYWAREVRVPLTAAVRAKLDLKQVKTLELTSRGGKGKAWLMDAWGWRPGTPAVRPAALPRVDLGRLKVKEGDSGTQTHRIPVRVSGKGSGTIRLSVIDAKTGKATSRVVTVEAGSHDVDVPITVPGNTRYGSEATHSVFAKAVRGAVVGSYAGGLTVQNDDPMPKITVEPVADRVTEGQKLSWRVKLSQAADLEIEGGFSVLPVKGGTELSTVDVDKTWLETALDQKPNPARPLSKAGDDPTLRMSIPAGKLSTVVSVPTVKDKLTEKDESLRLRLFTFDEHWETHPGVEVTGTVRNVK